MFAITPFFRGCADRRVVFELDLAFDFTFEIRGFFAFAPTARLAFLTGAFAGFFRFCLFAMLPSTRNQIARGQIATSTSSLD